MISCHALGWQSTRARKRLPHFSDCAGPHADHALGSPFMTKISNFTDGGERAMPCRLRGGGLGRPGSGTNQLARRVKWPIQPSNAHLVIRRRDATIRGIDEVAAHSQANICFVPATADRNSTDDHSA